MAKEWANKDKYHPSNGVLEFRMQMPRAKAIVRTVPAWGDRKVAGGAAGRSTPIRPVQVWADRILIFVLVRRFGLVRVVVVLVVGMGGLQVIWKGRTVHVLPFVVLVLLQLKRVGFLIVVTVVVFVEVVLI
jgi:hypothetical protein